MRKNRRKLLDKVLSLGGGLQLLLITSPFTAMAQSGLIAPAGIHTNNFSHGNFQNNHSWGHADNRQSGQTSSGSNQGNVTSQHSANTQGTQSITSSSGNTYIGNTQVMPAGGWAGSSYKYYHVHDLNALMQTKSTSVQNLPSGNSLSNFSSNHASDFASIHDLGTTVSSIIQPQHGEWKNALASSLLSPGSTLHGNNSASTTSANSNFSSANQSWIAGHSVHIWSNMNIRSTSYAPSINLDLTSTSQSMTAGHLLHGGTVTINVDGTSLTVNSHTELTPAEYLAVSQVVAGGEQSLVLNAQGAADCGSVVIGSHLSQELGSLIIPQGVTVIDLSKSGTLNLNGNITDDGNLYIASLNPAKDTLTVNANNINVQSQGLISDVLPAGTVSWLNNTNANLSLNALNDITNAGTISSGGSLSLTAGGSITNALPAGVTGVAPIIQATNNVNLTVSSGNIINSGAIASTNGNVTISSSGTNLSVDNTNGIIAAGGQLVFNTVQPALDQSGNPVAPGSLSVENGTLQGKTVSFTSPDGNISVNVDRINGDVQVSGGTAQVGAQEGNLTISQMNLTGDPIFYNFGGSLDLSGLFSGSTTFDTAGGDFVALATGDITASSISSNSIITTDGGAITLAAGVTFTITGVSSGTSGTGSPISCTSCSSSYSITAVNTSVGNINLTNGSNAVSLKSTGGNISLQANGTVNIGNLDASGTGGALSASGNGNAGGSAGTITINSTGSITTGYLHAYGGGGSGANFGTGGNGGAGENIYVTSTTGSITVSGDINTSGGGGGAGYEGNGGSGGAAGVVSISTSGAVSIAGPVLAAGGGSGGNGLNSHPPQVSGGGGSFGGGGGGVGAADGEAGGGINGVGASDGSGSGGGGGGGYYGGGGSNGSGSLGHGGIGAGQSVGSAFGVGGQSSFGQNGSNVGSGTNASITISGSSVAITGTVSSSFGFTTSPWASYSIVGGNISITETSKNGFTVGSSSTSSYSAGGINSLTNSISIDSISVGTSATSPLTGTGVTSGTYGLILTSLDLTNSTVQSDITILSGIAGSGVTVSGSSVSITSTTADVTLGSLTALDVPSTGIYTTVSITGSTSTSPVTLSVNNTGTIGGTLQFTNSGKSVATLTTSSSLSVTGTLSSDNNLTVSATSLSNSGTISATNTVSVTATTGNITSTVPGVISGGTSVVLAATLGSIGTSCSSPVNVNSPSVTATATSSGGSIYLSDSSSASTITLANISADTVSGTASFEATTSTGTIATTNPVSANTVILVSDNGSIGNSTTSAQVTASYLTAQATLGNVYLSTTSSLTLQPCVACSFTNKGGELYELTLSNSGSSLTISDNVSGASGVTISTTGTGTVEITSSYGVSSTNGNVSITTSGLTLDSSSTVSSTSGNVTIFTDALTLNSGSTLSAISGTVTLDVNTSGNTIGIGGGTGNLLIPSTYFSQITANTLVIGDTTNTKAINVGTTSGATFTNTLVLLTSGDISGTGTVTAGALVLNAGGSIYGSTNSSSNPLSVSTATLSAQAGTNVYLSDSYNGAVTLESNATYSTTNTAGGFYGLTLSHSGSSLTISNSVSGVSGVTVSTTGSGTIELGSSDGVSSTSGSVVITTSGLTLDSSSTVSSRSGNVTIYTNGLTMGTGSALSATSGVVTIDVETSGDTIGIGGGTGNLLIPSTYFSQITANTLVIGDTTNVSAINIGTTSGATFTNTLVLLSNGDIDGAGTVTAGTLVLNAGGSIYALSNPLSVSTATLSAQAGTNVYISDGYNGTVIVQSNATYATTNTAGGSYGLTLSNSGSLLTISDTISGTSGVAISTTGSGTVEITSSYDISSTSGNALITTSGLTLDTSNTISSTSGNVTIFTDSLTLNSGTLSAASGTVTIDVNTSGNTIGIGGGTGNLLIPSTYFSQITTNTLVVGDTTNTKAINIGTTSGATFTNTLVLLSNGDIDGPGTVTAGTLVLNAGGSIYGSSNSSSNPLLVSTATLSAQAGTNVYISDSYTGTVTVQSNGTYSVKNIAGGYYGLTLSNSGSSLILSNKVSGVSGVSIVTTGSGTVELASSKTISSTNGNVSITTSGLTLDISSIVSSTSGNVTIFTDALTLNSGSTLSATSGTVTLDVNTSGNTIGIGGGTGNLLIPSTYFSQITANTLVIGDATNVSAINIGSTSGATFTNTLVLLTSGDISGTGTVTAGALVLNAGGSIYGSSNSSSNPLSVSTATLSAQAGTNVYLSDSYNGAVTVESNATYSTTNTAGGYYGLTLSNSGSSLTISNSVSGVSGVTINTTGSGTIELGSSDSVSSTSGNVTITTSGLTLDSSSTVSSRSGNVTIYTNGLTMGTGSALSATSGVVTLDVETSGDTIGIGGGTGNLLIPSTYFSQITTNTLVVGDTTNTKAINIGTTSGATFTNTLVLLSNGDIDGAGTVTAGTLVLNAGGSIYGSSNSSSNPLSVSTATLSAQAGTNVYISDGYNGTVIVQSNATYATTNTAGGSYGLTLSNSGSLLTISDTISGTSGVAISTTGSGTIEITSSYGVSSTSGSVVITTSGLTLDTSNTISSTNGNVTIFTDSLTLNSGTLSAASGTVTIDVNTSGNIIGISGGTGGLQIPSGYFSQIIATTLVIGDTTNAGAIDIGSSGVSFGNNLSLLSASSVTFTGSVTISGGANLNVNAGGEITINSELSASIITLTDGLTTGTAITEFDSGSSSYDGVLNGILVLNLSGGTADLEGNNIVSSITVNGSGSATVVNIVTTTVNGTGTTTLNLANGTNDITIGTFTGGNTLNVTGGGDVTTSIDDSFSLLSLTGISTYTQSNNFTVTSGVTVDANGTVLISGQLNVSGSTVSLTSDNSEIIINNQVTATTITLTNATGTEITEFDSGSSTYDGVLNGAVVLNLSIGTADLEGNNAVMAITVNGSGSAVVTNTVATTIYQTGTTSLTLNNGTNDVVLGTFTSGNTLDVTAAGDITTQTNGTQNMAALTLNGSIITLSEALLATGAVQLTSTTVASGTGIEIDASLSGSSVTLATSGNSIIDVADNTTVLATTGNMSITTYGLNLNTSGELSTGSTILSQVISIDVNTAGETIGLGGGSGTFQLSAASPSSQIVTSILVIGDTTSAGAVTVGPSGFSFSGNLVILSTGDIAGTGTITAGGPLTLNSGGSIYGSSNTSPLSIAAGILSAQASNNVFISDSQSVALQDNSTYGVTNSASNIYYLTSAGYVAISDNVSASTVYIGSVNDIFGSGEVIATNNAALDSSTGSIYGVSSFSALQVSTPILAAEGEGNVYIAPASDITFQPNTTYNVNNIAGGTYTISSLSGNITINGALEADGAPYGIGMLMQALNGVVEFNPGSSITSLAGTLMVQAQNGIIVGASGGAAVTLNAGELTSTAETMTTVLPVGSVINNGPVFLSTFGGSTANIVIGDNVTINSRGGQNLNTTGDIQITSSGNLTVGNNDMLTAHGGNLWLLAAGNVSVGSGTTLQSIAKLDDNGGTFTTNSGAVVSNYFGGGIGIFSGNSSFDPNSLFFYAGNNSVFEPSSELDNLVLTRAQSNAITTTSGVSFDTNSSNVTNTGGSVIYVNGSSPLPSVDPASNNVYNINGGVVEINNAPGSSINFNNTTNIVDGVIIPAPSSPGSSSSPSSGSGSTIASSSGSSPNSSTNIQSTSILNLGVQTDRISTQVTVANQQNQAASSVVLTSSEDDEQVWFIAQGPNQPFTLADDQNTIIIGEEGTVLAIDDPRTILLQSGRLVVITDEIDVNVKTERETMNVAPHTAVLVDVRNPQITNATSIIGSIKLNVSSSGKSKAFTIGQGQEYSVNSVPLSSGTLTCIGCLSKLNSTGSTSLSSSEVAVEGMVVIGSLGITNQKVDAKKILDTDPLFGCGSSNTCLTKKVVSSIKQTLSQGDVKGIEYKGSFVRPLNKSNNLAYQLKPMGFSTPIAPSLLSVPKLKLITLSIGQGTIVKHSRGAEIKIQENKIVLKKGEAMIIAREPVTVDVGYGNVLIAPGSIVLLNKDDKHCKIHTLWEAKSKTVKFITGNHSLDIGVGQECLVAQNVKTIGEIQRLDSIGRRKMRQLSLSNGPQVATAEVSLLSIMIGSPVLNSMTDSIDEDEVAISNKVLKMAACLHVVTASHGEYVTLGSAPIITH